MLQIHCDRCHLELRAPGALMFSPPVSESWIVEKYHICVHCWSELSGLLEPRPTEGAPADDRS
jgi:hypothetical protein